MQEIIIEKNKKVSEVQIKELFMSVNWVSVNYSNILVKAINNSFVSFSAWNGETLIGLIRGLDDGGLQAVIDCLLINPEYQKIGLGSKLLNLIKEEYKDYLYISVVPDEKENVEFYEDNGFNVIESGTLLQICNIKTD